MAWKVTAMDVRMAAALANGVDDVAAFCRAQRISRQTYYKWKKRFELEGLDGLRDCSRRPGSIPIATPVEVEDAIVRARKELADAGEFNGPFTIAERLPAAGLSPGASRAPNAPVVGPPGRARPRACRRCRRGPRSLVCWLAGARSARRPVNVRAAPTVASRPRGRTRCG